MARVIQRGKDIYVGMVMIRTELEPLGVKYCFGPHTYDDATYQNDNMAGIAGKAYATSTEYFEAFSWWHLDSAKFPLIPPKPHYLIFAGAGVPPPKTSALTSTNNAWAVLANVKDEDKGTLPILITRNVDIEALNRALKTGITSNDFSTPVQLGAVYKTPFGKRAGVLVRKNGQVDQLQKTRTTLGMVFGNTEIPPRPDSEPPLMYLQP